MILNRADTASALGISGPTLDKWVRDGCPVKKKAGRGISSEFVLADVMNWRIERERAAAGGEDERDEQALKLRKLAADTGKAELEFAKARGDVAPVKDFERAQAKFNASIRANVMNVPARVVLQLLGESDETRFKAVLRSELTLALQQAAEAEMDLDDDEDDEADDDE